MRGMAGLRERVDDLRRVVPKYPHPFVDEDGLIVSFKFTHGCLDLREVSAPLVLGNTGRLTELEVLSKC
jgi:hypothetical protein